MAKIKKQTNKLLSKVPGLFKTIDYWYGNFDRSDNLISTKIIEDTVVFICPDKDSRNLIAVIVGSDMQTKITLDSGIYQWFDNFFEPIEE